jgi:hypothetical protein
MGIDAFERSRHRGEGLLDSEGLVPIYLGAELITPRVYYDWSEVFVDLDALEAQLPQITPSSRQIFATTMLRSLRRVATLFKGDSLSFEVKVGELVGAPTGAVDQSEIDQSSAALDVLLARSGFKQGSLAARITAWESANALPVDRLEATFQELVAAGKARTDATIFATGDYTMRLNPVRGVPYTARCGFVQRQMDLNIDIGFSRAAIKHLVAHEMFPGHATQLIYTRQRVGEGRSHPETLLCTANTVLGCVQEGIADEGVRLIDWIEDDNDAICLELRRLRSAAQTSAAWYLMAEHWPAEKVANYLREVAAGQEAWVQGRLRMAAHPFRGAFIASYWAGARAVRQVFDRLRPGEFPAFVEFLYGSAHSPQSLATFGVAA